MRGTGAEQLAVVMTTRESEFERRGCVNRHFHGVNPQGDEHRE
jgi:hypothetical protein